MVGEGWGEGVMVQTFRYSHVWYQMEGLDDDE